MSKLEQAARQALNTLNEMELYSDGVVYTSKNNVEEAITALRESLAEQAEQSGGPVGVIGWAANIPNTMEEVHWEDECPPIGTTLYAAPVRTVDLTDDEIDGMVVETLETWNSKDTMKNFARAVIAADRRKNQ